MTTQNAKEKIDQLLKWLMGQVNKYPGVHVTNFTSSWKDGKALYALLNSLLGDDVINRNEMTDDKRMNFTKAIQVASDAGIPDLVEADDLCDCPIDRLCMITYLHIIYKQLYLLKKLQKERKLLADEPIESENPFTKKEVTE